MLANLKLSVSTQLFSAHAHLLSSSLLAFSLRLLLYSSHRRSLADFPSTTRGRLNNEDRSGVDLDLFSVDNDEFDFFLGDFFNLSLFFFLEWYIRVLKTDILNLEKRPQELKGSKKDLFSARSSSSLMKSSSPLLDFCDSVVAS